MLLRCFNFRWPPGCPDQVGRAPVPSGTKASVHWFSCGFLEPSSGWLLVQAAPVVHCSSQAAAWLPNHTLLCPRDEEEIYDDVETVEPVKRDRSVPLPPTSRPPAYLRPGGGGYRLGAGCGASGSTENPANSAASSNCTGLAAPMHRRVSLPPCKQARVTLIP